MYLYITLSWGMIVFWIIPHDKGSRGLGVEDPQGFLDKLICLKLDQIVWRSTISLIRHIENVELPKLEKNLQDIKGLFKGKEKKAAQDKIDQCKKRLSGQKDQLKKIVRESGYATVKSFIENYNRAYGIVTEYQKELRQWEQQTGNGKKNMKQETVRQKESVRAKLKRNV